MTSKTKQRTVQVVGVLIGIGLLYLALRGVDFSQMGEALRTADYRWMVAFVAVLLGSHFLRALRWQMLLEALPSDADTPPKRVSLKTAFYSVMIGFMVNCATPRLGEIARTANLASRERLPFTGVFGTVVMERLLDMVMLLLLLTAILFLIADAPALTTFTDPVRSRIAELSVASVLILAALLVGLMGFAFWMWQWVRRQSFASNSIVGRMVPLLLSFQQGLLTVFRAPRRFGILWTTALMWVGYLFMVHIPFLVLHMTVPYGITLSTSLVVLGFGTIGFILPSPAGTGSYHYAVIQTLVLLFGVPQEPAATYAVLNHAAQILLYTTVGFVCLMLQGSGWSTLKQTTPPEDQIHHKMEATTAQGNNQ